MTKPGLHHDSSFHLAIVVAFLFLAKDQLDVLAKETEHLTTPNALFCFSPRIGKFRLLHL